MASAQTSIIREDHTMWICQQAMVGNSPCGSYNHMDTPSCEACHTKRDVGDLAANAANDKIGTLVRVEFNIEWWQYDR